MPHLPDTPQLPLDFEGAPIGAADGNVAKSNVLDMAAAFLRQRTAKPPSVLEDPDSILDEVLSNARRLNW
jgi:hypothetical protein